MAKVCCVCNDSKDSPENLLFSCKGHGCDVTVHQACYGIVSVPTGLWFCRKCESQERAARVRCELCPKKEGALKRNDCGGWAHVVCALYIPEVTFGNNRTMEPIVTSKLPKERFNKSCYICEDHGLESQATYGACMSCHKSSCRLTFHVTCAQREHLLCEEEDPRDPRNIIYCGYCSTHFKKMIRQKHKQNLRKHIGTPTASTAPPLPPPMNTTTTPSHPASLPGLTAKERETPQKIKVKVKEELPHKRVSTDAPIPPAKRKYRRRKLSSSNESTTSETPSNMSDIPPQHPPAIIPGSPSSMTAQSPVLTIANKGRGPSPEAPPTSSQKVEAPSLITHPQPLSPTSVSLGLPMGGGGGGRGVSTTRQAGSTSSDQSGASKVQIPPLSLHELLERQWEQTAQFILDQAGRQNNAGVMLAHLHQLQSENKHMQTRIMELASQREFYIATNTRLRQTLAEHELTRLPNGVQPLGEGVLPIVTSSEETQDQRTNSSELRRSQSQLVVSNTIPKSVQDSLLQAHFQATSLPPNPAASSSNTTPPPGSRSRGQHELHGEAQQHAMSYHASNSLHSSPTPGLYPVSLSGSPLQEGEKAGVFHEITQVTNSIQAPITTFTPLPGANMNWSMLGGPHLASAGFYRPPGTHPADKT